MRKLIIFSLVAAMLLMPMTVFADDVEDVLSDTAEIRYGYDASYDQSSTTAQTTSEEESRYAAQPDSSTTSDVGQQYYDEGSFEPTEGGASTAAAGTIRVFVNGKEVVFDVKPTIINSRTMVPMRAIFEALGADVSWDNASRTAIGTMNGITVRIKIGEAKLYRNSEEVTLDSPAIISGNRTLVPVRAIAESFDCTVEWYNATRVVDIIG